MRKALIFFFLAFKFFYILAQDPDSLVIDKWVNYNRPRGVGDSYPFKWPSKIYITPDGDTLVRTFAVSAEFHQVLSETSYLHDQRNGLSINYFPNGVVKEVSYYFNDRIWEVISRSDSAGKLLYPGDLHNGNGTKYFSDELGYEPNCYETFKNGLPEGMFYWQGDQYSKVKGKLTYKKSEVRYRPAKNVTFITNFSGKKSTLVFDTAEFKSIFMEDSIRDYKILSVVDDSLEEPVKIYKFINVGFGDDPATIPRGTWQVINPKNGRVITQVVYDDHGNAIKVTMFKENGEILSEKKYPSYDKRIW